MIFPQGDEKIRTIINEVIVIRISRQISPLLSKKFFKIQCNFYRFTTLTSILSIFLKFSPHCTGRKFYWDTQLGLHEEDHETENPLHTPFQGFSSISHPISSCTDSELV